jgi:hypothetical protein
MVIRWTTALVTGALFGAGLAVSGRADPTRGRTFLDLSSGARDPTLAVVASRATIPIAIAWAARPRLYAPVPLPDFTVSETNPITPRLIAGHGAVRDRLGHCRAVPPPVTTDLALRPVQSGTFIVAILAGFALRRRVDHSTPFRRRAPV